MQNELLAIRAAGVTVETLGVIGGAKRGGDQRLRLAAREQRRAVGAWKHPNFASDSPQSSRLASIESLALIEYHTTNSFLPDVIPSAVYDKLRCTLPV